MTEKNRKRRSPAPAGARKRVAPTVPQSAEQLSSAAPEPTSVPECISAVASDSTVVSFQSALEEARPAEFTRIEAAPSEPVVLEAEPQPQLVPRFAEELSSPAPELVSVSESTSVPEPISAVASESTVLTFQSALEEAPLAEFTRIEEAANEPVVLDAEPEPQPVPRFAEELSSPVPELISVSEFTSVPELVSAVASDFTVVSFQSALEEAPLAEPTRIEEAANEPVVLEAEPTPQFVPQFAEQLTSPAPELISVPELTSAIASDSTELTFQNALNELSLAETTQIQSTPIKPASQFAFRLKRAVALFAKRVKSTQFQKSESSLVLSRAWSWLHRKYTVSTNKRLRVAETVALGEKRFVALVSVEGREFLIGGGAQNVSLLAHLGRAPQQQDSFRAALAAIGDSE